jgi:hypothetical protein
MGLATISHAADINAVFGSSPDGREAEETRVSGGSGPLVSIVRPVHNEEECLPKCIFAVLVQGLVQETSLHR